MSIFTNSFYCGSVELLVCLSLSLSDPCLNGGSCVDGVGGFSCDCRPGFDGERCEAEMDECASQPCRNGAMCRDYVNSFVCECRPGFDGILCEHNIPECTERWVTKDCNCSHCVKVFAVDSLKIILQRVFLFDMWLHVDWDAFRKKY